ncbi:ATP-dependent RecD-like DNA helicase [Streptomonospora nanhaiensis]|uniref:ATP-dependent RecD2 DNA helicase n=1 Tax=Streptomonospora nanhaiensis TaxID=1323731 RepID=A0A853BR15_9ACTN|nr:ATP-dependent RecD-like DNA helicase [Streptomonospora nanhaiensis]MBV2362807.1 ATP-dependent RecD-like DNA helicase [Streptomonospora nanhaiensis]MBX9386976.1 ATP-dependent RecD-like DNA helicase [Streptomonospora nanhaiensis]NYI97838.1 exodeoxyribonuclease V alpha subunit [Streptomonospora nanhaiensis]
MGQGSGQRGAGAGGFRPAVLEGVLERVTFSNEETGYTVAKVDTGRGGGELTTVVGALLGAQPGESLRMEGRWGSHPQYGRQFMVENYTTVLPATVQGVRRYLGSGLVKGIGPRLAERIVDFFGVDALDVIEHTPERLIEVPSLGPKRTRLIAEAWEEQKAIKEVMVFLQGIEVSTSLAVRIYKKYGDSAIDVVRTEPYRLAADVWGIGFKTADTIAQAVGIPHDSPQRVMAGIQFTLSESTSEGHCYLPEERLIAEAVKILQVDSGLVIECLATLVAEEGVVTEKVPGPDGEPVTAVYLVPFHRAEAALAAQLRGLLSAAEDRLPAFADVDWDVALKWLGERTGAALAPEQEQAVRLALTRKVAVLTGGPGCGKSFTVASIITLAAAKRAKIILAAPTGRAAKRMTELTGHDASTVHRLLELKPGGDASYDRDRPLDCDLLVVDEASMLDLLLANKLAKAVPPGAHLLLVGDVDQLPSVGAGQVLRDLLHDRSPLPNVRLTHVFRQAQQSGVVTNAHRVNTGRPPELAGMTDFFLFPSDDPEATAHLTVDVVANRIPRRFGLDPRRDVQVLAPMHRGPAGAGNLNTLLQEALTPAREGTPERRFGGRTFRVGDKVTQIRNNYDKGANGVFNGTLGVITGIDSVEQAVTVRTDEDEDVSYDFAELDELVHAYAVTVHRSQGSEYPAVVIPITTSAWMMLQRNLLYTAITRAKKLVVLVGSRRAVAQAVRNATAGRRHTALAHRLADS